MQSAGIGTPGMSTLCRNQIVHAMIAPALAELLRLPVAHAALRCAIPEANPTPYFGLSIGVTFPIKILVGIPLYAHIAQTALG